jgi:hypothetical protein
MTSPVERISALEGQHRLLDGHPAPVDGIGQHAIGAQLRQGGAGHDPGRHLRQRHAGRLGDERHGAAGAGVGLQHEHLAPLDRVLDVDEADHAETLGQAAGVVDQDLAGGRIEVWRRDGAGAVAAVHARLLDVLHDPADDEVAGAVAEGVDVDLDGVLQEAVDQHRTLGGEAALPPERAGAGELVHGGDQLVAVVHDRHGPAAEDVGGPDQGWEADAVADLERPLDVDRRAAGRLRNLQLGAEGVPPPAILGQIDGVGWRPQDEAGRQVVGQLQRGLAAQGHDDPGGLFDVDDVLHVLERQRLEVEPVAGVVVGGDGLRVAVHHHRLVSGLAQSEAGVHAAVVELDALADAVRP